MDAGVMAADMPSTLATILSKSGTIEQPIETNVIGSPALRPKTADGTGKGVAVANLYRLKADGSWTYEPVARYDSAQQAYVPLPIDLGGEIDQVFLILYGTGIRHASGPAATRVAFGGVPGSVTYAGTQGFYPGLDQVNVLLPRNLTGQGETDVMLTVDGVPANTVEIAIR